MKLYLSHHANRELSKIPSSLAETIEKHIQLLSENPYPTNSKKLQGADNWRIRIGSFRVIYTIDTKRKEITILHVADRKTIYR